MTDMQKPSVNEISPKLPSDLGSRRAARGGHDPSTTDQWLQWFDDNLPAEAPRPSRERCAALAKDSDEMALRPGGPCRQPLPEEQARRRGTMMEVAASFLSAIHHYQEIAPDPPDSHAALCIEIGRQLESIGVIARVRTPTAQRSPGHPAGWNHEFGRWLAGRIAAELRASGYRGSISIQQEKSATVGIVCEAMNYMFGLDIPPAGFASAMRWRHRRKELTLEERFPQFGRLRNLDK
jgi:hypothetical protein